MENHHTTPGGLFAYQPRPPTCQYGSALSPTCPRVSWVHVLLFHVEPGRQRLEPIQIPLFPGGSAPAPRVGALSRQFQNLSDETRRSPTFHVNRSRHPLESPLGAGHRHGTVKVRPRGPAPGTRDVAMRHRTEGSRKRETGTAAEGLRLRTARHSRLMIAATTCNSRDTVEHEEHEEHERHCHNTQCLLPKECRMRLRWLPLRST